jgi:hypothetical protein
LLVQQLAAAVAAAGGCSPTWQQRTLPSTCSGRLWQPAAAVAVVGQHRQHHQQQGLWLAAAPVVVAVAARLLQQPQQQHLLLLLLLLVLAAVLPVLVLPVVAWRSCLRTLAPLLMAWSATWRRVSRCCLCDVCVLSVAVMPPSHPS